MHNDEPTTDTDDTPPTGRWVLPRPATAEPAMPAPGPVATAAPPPDPIPESEWVRPVVGSWGVHRATGTADRTAPAPWQRDQPAGAPAPAQADPVDLPAVAAGASLALAIGVGLLLFGGFLAGVSGHTFIGTALVTQFNRSFRFRLLAVFNEATLGAAALLLLAVVLAAFVPTDRVPRLRRPALATTAGLGVYVAMGALLKTIVLLTLLRDSATLSLGSALGALAAIPAAVMATVTAALVIARDDRSRRSR